MPTAPVLVLTAMPEEALPLRERLAEPREIPVPLAGATAVGGMLQDRPVVLVTTGIGLAAATAACTWAVLAHAPRAVLSAGSAGGLAADIEVGTLVIGTAFAYSLADATAFGYAPGQVPGQPPLFAADEELAARAAAVPALAEARAGLALSGDAFVTADLAAPLRERFPGALSADMESTALAQTCAALGAPFLSLRAISDLCGPAAGQQFHLELDQVAVTSADAVQALLRSLD